MTVKLYINYFLSLHILMSFASLPRRFPESPASPTKKNIVRPDYEHQIYNVYTKSGQSLYNVTYLISRVQHFVNTVVSEYTLHTTQPSIVLNKLLQHPWYHY